jgi:hypothetical protein
MDVSISNDSDFIKKASHIIHPGVGAFWEAMDNIMSQIDFDIAVDMKKGDVLNEQNLRIVRPRLGLPTKCLEVVLGKMVKKDVMCGTVLEWDLLK